ncbi:MAG TPA: D-arabinono-1,4-lactone oxidase [Caulobacteraceae bacterium]|jgi:FAD-linked oxidoreductase|nr:D-arabinono-1,4-lactone oxidase [Caulobacteraceae bacterium]
MANWRNWSGSVHAAPSRMFRPRTGDELSLAVREAARVRVTGAGHSFMPLCETDGLLLQLGELEGAIELCADGVSAWVPAGWPIHKLTPALWELGFSLFNQGDIDRQVIAGALSTGTHGTGAGLGSLSTQALGYRLMGPNGDIVECDGETRGELFQAQRLSLGALGVAVAVRLALAPAYRLRETTRPMSLDEALEAWPELAAQNRHVEFFVFPYAETALLKILEPVDAGDDRPASVWLESAALQVVSDLARLAPGLAPSLQRLLTRAITPASRAAPAHRIFPSDRPTRFEEMEYEIPAAAGPAALRAAIAEVRRRGFPIIFPFEFRQVAADDIWLSPMQGRGCVSISFHQYAPMDWREPFAAIERVFADHGGRPHWAKRHTLGAADVLRLYPDAGRWGETRRAADPQAKFLNEHLRELFAFSL